MFAICVVVVRRRTSAAVVIQRLTIATGLGIGGMSAAALGLPIGIGYDALGGKSNASYNRRSVC